jgi:hypothetical protein
MLPWLNSLIGFPSRMAFAKIDILRARSKPIILGFGARVPVIFVTIDVCVASQSGWLAKF